ncbi:MAG: imidazoleglycerol-phosphate dehydratase HisB [Candidatus Omnitrophota bacterium]
MKKRIAIIKRKTNEVDISVKLNIDGTGKSEIDTGFKSLDHMLTLFCFHGFFDLKLSAKGDLQHHIVEDIGITLGEAFKKAIGEAKGIKRFGYSTMPMDEILVSTAIDLSGRPFLKFNIPAISENLDLKAHDFKTFLESFVSHNKLALHITYAEDLGSSDTHHFIEAVFKSLALSLSMAISIDSRRKEVPSTKGVLDL